MFDKPNRLEKDVNVTCASRPVKVAFLVPFDESKENHNILDDIFEYCYTCWAGTRFIILTINPEGEFQNDDDIKWLSSYDADVVYSYRSLSSKTINLIEQCNSPASLIKHDYGRGDERIYHPNIDAYFSPVGSISTIHSPSLFSDNTLRGSNDLVTIITQYDPVEGDRFVTDNFGKTIKNSSFLNEVPGLFKTICLTPLNTPENHHVGTERVYSLAKLLEKLARREAYPISRLAALHSEELPVINSNRIGASFSLVIGKTVEDRLLFWNLRHHYTLNESCLGCMIVSPDNFGEGFTEALGQYLNKNNFTGGGGQSYVSIRSRSVSKSKLESDFQCMVQEHTHNTVQVKDDFDQMASPTEEERRYTFCSDSDMQNIKISEDRSICKIEEPSHFVYIQPKYNSQRLGEYCVETYIERNENNSRFSNVTDTWQLPKRAFIAPIFGNECIRISKANIPVYKVGEKTTLFSPSKPKPQLVLSIVLPNDIDTIEWIIRRKGSYHEGDERHELPVSKIQYINLSTPGKNLNGVISMFDSLNQASLFLTNKFWRQVFEKFDKKSSIKYGVLDGLLPKGKNISELLSQSLRFTEKKQVSKYLKACLKDALNELIDREVFFPVYTWNCGYCGHLNTKTVELLDRLNPCEVCRKNHAIPIDNKFEWKYKLNKFVHHTLTETDSLLVLWALNCLQQTPLKDSFYYLPQTNIFYKEGGNNEVDFLGVMGGRFFLGEAKRSADYFLKNEREKRKFLDVVAEALPDVAVLAFMQYSEKINNKTDILSQIEEFKVLFRKELSEVELRIMIAEDDYEFSSYTTDFGGVGDNVLLMYDSIDNK